MVIIYPISIRWEHEWALKMIIKLLTKGKSFIKKKLRRWRKWKRRK